MGKRKRNLQTAVADMKKQDDEHIENVNKKSVVAVYEQKDEEDKSFEELGLDSRLIRALSEKSIEKPTPIQCVAIPLILEGKDVVVQAKTGSGKTLAYLLPLLQKLFVDSPSKKSVGPSTIVMVPTRELCQQVLAESKSLIQLCKLELKVALLTSMMSSTELKTSLEGNPDIIVSTPACVQSCLGKGLLQPKALQESLAVLILDEADLLLSYGYEDDLKSLKAHVAESCQCLLMSATSSADVEKLKKLILHNPYILTLPEGGGVKDEVIPHNVQQFYVWILGFLMQFISLLCSLDDELKISCNVHDKLLHVLALLKLELIQKKVLIFTNSIDMAYRMKLFLEQFGLKSALLNAELPQNSRMRIVEQFNVNLFDYLIVADDNQSPAEHRAEGNPSQKKSKLSVVRGIEFKNVNTVVNFDMPQTASGYVHRIGRSEEHTALISPKEMDIFNEIKSFLGEDGAGDSKFIAPFPLLSKNAVESLRYRAEDVARSVTKIKVREARAYDLRNEILKSEKLKSHFEDNPKDLELLKRDKVLSKKPLASHLQDIPQYLLDPATKEVSKILKLARAAMGTTHVNNGSKRKFRSRHPRKTSSEGSRRTRRKTKETD